MGIEPPIGQITQRVAIVNITNSLPCEITTEVPHLFPHHSYVRLTDLNGAMPVPHGQDQLNNCRFRIVVTGDTTYTLEYPVTFLPVDSTTYPAYLVGGSCNLIQQNYIYLPSPTQIQNQE